MPHLPPAPHRDTAARHRHLPVSRRFAPLRREATHDSVGAVDERGASLKLQVRLTIWRAFDTKHPGAPPRDNRSTHQTRDADRALRTLLLAVAARVRLP